MRKYLGFAIFHLIFYLSHSLSTLKPLNTHEFNPFLKTEGIDVLVISMICVGIIVLVVIGLLVSKYVFKSGTDNNPANNKGDKTSLGSKEEKNKEDDYNISEMIKKDIENYKKELQEERDRKTISISNNNSHSDIRELVNNDITSNNFRETKINSYCDTPSTRDYNNNNNISYKIDLDHPGYNFSLKPKGTIETSIDPVTAIQLKEIKLKKVIENFKQKIDLVVIDEVEEDKNEIIRTKSKNLKHSLSKEKDNSDLSSIGSSTLNQIKKEKSVNLSNTYRSEPNDSFYEKNIESLGNFDKNIDFSKNIQSEGNIMFRNVDEELDAK